MRAAFSAGKHNQQGEIMNGLAAQGVDIFDGPPRSVQGPFYHNSALTYYLDSSIL
jgi:hypothetical protein